MYAADSSEDLGHLSAGLGAAIDCGRLDLVERLMERCRPKDGMEEDTLLADFLVFGSRMLERAACARNLEVLRALLATPMAPCCGREARRDALSLALRLGLTEVAAVLNLNECV